jgi:hypothetical protein
VRRQPHYETVNGEVGFCVEQRDEPDGALPAIGARLELTRRALDLTPFQMARLRTDMPTWGTYEAGWNPPEQAVKLSAYGIPLGWMCQAGWPTRNGVRLNEHLEHDCGLTIFQHACKMGLKVFSQSDWDRVTDLDVLQTG